MIDKIRSLRKNLTFILLMGVNGAGKGKKGLILEYLAEAFGTYRIVMSDLIDRHVRDKTPLGLQFAAQKAVKDAGNLLSDAAVFEAVEMEILRLYALYETSGYKGECTIILDGYPRSMGDDTDQLKRFLSYRVPFSAFEFKIDEATCLHRVIERAKNEGKRGDEKSAPDRFVRLGRGNSKMLRVIKAANPNSAVTIDGTLPVRDQLMRVMKKCYSPSNVMKMAKCLDMRDHRARKLMDEIEGKTHRGGASAHAVHNTQRVEHAVGSGDARELVAAP